MARISRVYLPPEAFLGDDTVAIDRTTSHYLRTVLRLKPGNQWAALDGQGRSWLCELKDEKCAHRVGHWKAIDPLPLPITVALALCKGSRFEDALEKLAELGVVSTIPLETERTERSQPNAQKLLRWQQISHAASALANRLYPMQVKPPLTLDAFFKTSDPTLLTFACQGGGMPLATLLPKNPQPIELLIGPEGGFSPTEIQNLKNVAHLAALGPLTLRVETAAVCAVSVALAHYPTTAP